MDRNFQYAVHSAKKDKIDFTNVGGKTCLHIREVIYEIRSFNFYKVSDIFTEDTVIIRTSQVERLPKLKIPIPAIRRTIKYDNKFFLTQVRKSPNAPTYGHTAVTGKPDKSADLFAPFLYFYFEESQFEKQQGYISTVYPKYSSKLDRNITFVDFNTHFERENEELKNEAVEIFTQMEELERQKQEREDKLFELDPGGRVAYEFEAMREKLRNATMEDD